MTKVAQWVNTELLATPSRFTPILLMDLNDRFAIGDDGDETVGFHPTGKEGEAGKLYHRNLHNAYMAVANTYYDTGPTFVGHNSTSITEYICIPTGLVSHTLQCRVWNDAALALQISRRFKDHKPLIIKLEAPPACHAEATTYQTLDRDAMALGLKEGHKRIEFLDSYQH